MRWICAIHGLRGEGGRYGAPRPGPSSGCWSSRAGLWRRRGGRAMPRATCVVGRAGHGPGLDRRCSSTHPLPGAARGDRRRWLGEPGRPAGPVWPTHRLSCGSRNGDRSGGAAVTPGGRPYRERVSPGWGMVGSGVLRCVDRARGATPVGRARVLSPPDEDLGDGAERGVGGAQPDDTPQPRRPGGEHHLPQRHRHREIAARSGEGLSHRLLE